MAKCKSCNGTGKGSLDGPPMCEECKDTGRHPQDPRRYCDNCHGEAGCYDCDGTGVEEIIQDEPLSDEIEQRIQKTVQAFDVLETLRDAVKDMGTREAKSQTFDSKYVCEGEGCGGSNYKVVGFGEAMKHYVKNFGNSPPVFRCTNCGEDATGNDIERFRDMGQELHDQWKAKWKGNNMSEENRVEASTTEASVKTAAACTTCDGTGLKQCFSGLGLRPEDDCYCSEPSPHHHDCSIPLNEHVESDCLSCNGTAECSECGGTGDFDDDDCEECNGEGSCYSCGFPDGKIRSHACPKCSGRKASIKTSLENPFDGYGRPFSEDPLNPNVDPAYYGDNPANNVKPYAGPNSYSINTTAPYMPPNSGMEDPGQNVGPYSPPGYEEEAAEFGLAGAEGMQTTAKSYDSWNNETEWFDGTSESIYRRIASAREIQKTADKSTANLIEEQVKVLEKVANEFADSSLAEYMTSVPGGTVAMDYDDLMDGGLVDLSSFISTEAHKYITEVNAYDWEKFANDAPRMWVTAKAQNNPGVLRHEGATREAAIDYVASKTMVLMDPVLRADIIDNFVGDVEVERRSYLAAADQNAEVEAARKQEFERQQRARVAAELNELEYADDATLFPGQTTVGSNDPFDFGADDGSAMYAEAKKVVEAHSNRNWETFCTDGARDWFYSNDTPMFRYADTTRHAAKQYLDEETTLIKDPAFKNEIRRAFLASVDFLREEWLEKQALLQEPEEDIDVLSQYYDDETLW